MSIRGRLALVLAVPLVALLGVTTYGVTSAFADSREASRLARDAEVGLAAFDLIDALQAERARLATGEAVTAEERDAVTRATDLLRDRAADADPELRTAVERALERSSAAGLLAGTSTGGIVAIDGYTPAINSLLSVARLGFDPGSAIDDQPATTTDFLASAEEAAALERDLLVAMSVDSDLVPRRLGEVESLAAQQQIILEEAARAAESDLAPRIDSVNDRVTAAVDDRQDLLVDGSEAAAVQDWLAGSGERIEDLRNLRNEAATLAVDAVDSLASSGRQVLLLSLLAFVGTVIVTGLLVRSATRSIARPLQDLAAQAEDVAMHRLPEAVQAQQDDDAEVRLPALRATGAAEVREVAEAFNDIQDTALRLAGEQAVLRRNQAEALTNLGRRNQALLGRQLDFISSLEKRETDPAFLDHLFRLDHLASRMRRNAESLLILAGSETPRRRRKPADVAEVVRAAMSEVEDFERVRLGHLGEGVLVGPVVIDLVHLLAELIENALGFSPPETTVEIDGRSLGQGGYQLAVIDHGVGMSDVEFVSANQRLAGLDEVDGMPTRYLGQYVIAKLAAKIGAIVRLQPSVGGRGVTAVVSLPASAVVGGANRSGAALPLPGTRAAREKGPDPFAPGAGLSVTAQPEPVVDPDADPFADPAPALGSSAGEPVATESWVGDSVPEEWVPTGSELVEPESVEPELVEPESVEPESVEPESVEPESVEPESESAQPVEASATEVSELDRLWLPAGRADGSEPTEDGFDRVAAPEMPTPPPPPLPPSVLEQQGWEVPAGDAAEPEPAMSTDPGRSPSTEDLVAPLHETADPFQVAPPTHPMADQPSVIEEGEHPPTLVPTPAGVPDEQPVHPAARGGGLARRVPGASLATSPLGTQVETPVPAGERSADGVRSMLASFQSGRARGRNAETSTSQQPTPSSPEGSVVAHPLSADADRVDEPSPVDGLLARIDDGRLGGAPSQEPSGVPTGPGPEDAQEANEWEDPR